MEFIQSILEYQHLAVINTVDNYDLPVNPLSHILIQLKMDLGTPAIDSVPNFQKVFECLARIEVLYKGSAVYSLNGMDCFASGILVNGFESWAVNHVDEDDTEWCITFLVPMTRVLYSPLECFPRTTRGELILQITWGAAFTGFDIVNLQIETVELPDAAPVQFIKQTTKAVTPTATGQLDIELPIGNDISELVLWAETIPAGAVDTATLEMLEILVDNVNHFYPESNYNTIHNMAGRMRACPGYHGYHTHKLLAAAFAQGDQVSAPKPENHVIPNHLHLPFDIFRNGEYALKTAGASDVVLRVDAGDVGDIRCVPVEVVKSAGAV